MKRLVLVLVPLALGFSGCVLPVIKSPTYLSDKGAVFNANIYSSVNGDAEYWWRISFANGGGGTSNHTVTLANQQPGAVSTPFTILDPNTTYHLTLCAQDHQLNPPRPNCTAPTDFQTPPAGGRSGILFEGAGGTWIMDQDGSNKAFLTAGGFPTWSPDGTKIAVQGTLNGQSGVIKMNADGSNKVNLTPEAGFSGRPAWSPDGTKIAFTHRESGPDGAIWVMNADGTNKKLLVSDNGSEVQAAWRPDGEKIAFTHNIPNSSGTGTRKQIFMMNPDGSAQTNISNSSGDDYESAWSPDASKILFKHNGDLWTMRPDGSNRTDLSPIFNQDDYGSWSPDGGKIAFVTYRAGGEEVWKMDANGANPIALTNHTSGFAGYPVWSPRP